MSAFLDERPRPVRSLSRFLVFALVVVIAVSGPHGAAVLPPDRRRRPAGDPRHAKSDGPGGDPVAARPDLRPERPRPRHQRRHVRRSSSGPSDLPLEQRPAVVDRLAALLSMPAGDINATIDGNPGSTFDLVRIASDVDETHRPADLRGRFRPARRRGRRRGSALVHRRPADVADPRLHGPGLRRAAPRAQAGRLPPRRPHRQGRHRGPVRDRAARHLRHARASSANASGRKTQVLQTIAQAQPGDSLTLTIDTKEQRNAQKALLWAMKKVGIKRGVVIAMNPQTGRGPRARQPADLRQQPVRPRDQQQGLRQAAQEPGQAASQPRDAGALPARLDLQARGRHRRAGRQEDHAEHEDPHGGLPHARVDAVLRLEPSRLRAVQHLLRLRPFERHVLLPDGRQARDRPPRLLGEAVRLRGPDRDRPPRRGRRDRPDEPVEAGHPRRQGLRAARRIRRGSARATTWSRRSS